MMFPPLAFGAMAGVVPTAARPYREKVLLASIFPESKLIPMLVIAAVCDHNPATKPA